MRKLLLAAVSVAGAVGAGCNLFFDPNTVPRPSSGTTTFDSFSASPEFAGLNAEVVLRFNASRILDEDLRGDAPNPEVGFAGSRMECSQEQSRYTCRLQVTEALPEGRHGFQILWTDPGAAQQELALSGVQVEVDRTAPLVTLGFDAPTLFRGGLAPFSVTADEPFSNDPPVITAGFLSGAPHCVSSSPTSFRCTGTVSLAAAEGGAPAQAAAKDRAGNPGTSAEVTVEISAQPTEKPVVTIEAFSRAVRPGGTFSVTFTTDQPITQCRVNFAGTFASCPPPTNARTCTCPVGVAAGETEGLKDLFAYATNTKGEGRSDPASPVRVDGTLPVVNANAIAILRRPSGVADQVGGDGGTVFDPPGTAAQGSGVDRVNIWDAPAGGQLVAFVASPEPDGGTRPGAAGVLSGGISFQAFALPGTELSSPPQLWVSAVDLAGNESGLSEILAGASALDAGPTLVQAGIRIFRRPVGALDTLEADAGAFLSGVCGVSGLRAFAVDAGMLLGAPAILGDGSLEPFPLGSALSAPARIEVEAVDKCGRESPPVEVVVGRSTSASQFSIGTVRFVRRPQGQVDGLVADPGAFPAVRCFPREFEVHQTSGGGVPLASGLLVDGGFAELPIGDAGSSIASLYVVGRDKCELATAPQPVPVGAGSAQPNIPQMEIVRREMGLVDGVRGLPGSFFLDGCAITRVQLSSDELATSRIGEGPVLPDSSFAEIPIGDAGSTYPEVWVQGLDRCGSPPSPSVGKIVLLGRDLDPPSVDGAAITLLARAGATPDGVEGATGAIGQAPFVRSVTLHVQDGGVLSSSFLPSANGSFPEQDVGNVFGDRIWVRAVDKAGNVSPLTPNRGVAATFNLVGRQRYANTVPEVALYPFVSASDPREAGPGLGVVLGGEASAAMSMAASAHDGLSAVTDAGPATESSPFTWTDGGVVSVKPFEASIAFDRNLGGLLLFARGNTSNRETWKWVGGNWTRLADPIPQFQSVLHKVVFDERRGRTVAVEGFVASGAPTQTYDFLGDPADAGTWVASSPSGPRPINRNSFGLAYDAARAKVVLFGGSTAGSELWEYDGIQWTRRPDAPAPRTGIGMAYDALRNRLVVGQAGQPTLEFDGEAWTSGVIGLAGLDTPAVTYDLLHDRTLLASTTGGTQSWDGGTWTTLAAIASPPARTGGSMTFDPLRGRCALFGDNTGTPTSSALYECSQQTPGPRYVGHSGFFHFDPAAVLSSLTVSYVGAGVGQAGPGVELRIWNWATGGWELLGSHDLASPSPIQGTPSDPIANYHRDGIVWILASPASGSSTPPGVLQTGLSTDYLEFGATYALP